MDAGNNVERNRNNNDLDALEIRPADRDPFPKADLKGGFIGDRFPLCAEVDASLGSFKYVGPIGDAPVLAADDALYEVLCAEVDGACNAGKVWQCFQHCFGGLQPGFGALNKSLAF